MNAFSYVEKNYGLNERIREADLYPLSERGNQISAVIAGVKAASLEKRKAHNLSVKTVGERKYSFGAGDVKPLSNWNDTLEDARTAYSGLRAVISRSDSAGDNGRDRLNEFALDTCIKHGIGSVAEFVELMEAVDEDSDG